MVLRGQERVLEGLAAALECKCMGGVWEIGKSRKASFGKIGGEV